MTSDVLRQRNGHGRRIESRADVARRSDAQIFRAVVKALNWSACLPRTVVQVEVVNGHVTLSGELESLSQHDAATSVARWLTGVTGVSNHTIIRPATRRRERVAARVDQGRDGGDHVNLPRTARS
jgi:osmotically-inducible protein OsmY